MDKPLKTETIRLTASGQVYNKPCLVFSLCGIGVANATNVINIFDGFKTTDKQVMSLVTVAYTSDSRNFDPPLYFSKGVYVEFATNADEIFVQFFDPNQ